MKTERSIFLAFILNLGFSVFELIGGVFTGSVAIMSDAVHDFGDAVSIGIACFLEKKSRKQPDDAFTYGYGRYSVLGSVITTLILVVGSLAVIYNAVCRIFNPVEIHYDGMIVFALVGVCVNLFAAFFTREGDSLNQKAVNLHMLEDVLGWAVVLVGAVVMRFTDFALLDSVLSVAVAVFILVNACRNLREAVYLLMERAPRDVDVSEMKAHILEVDGVLDVHHVHIWSMDGNGHYGTMHIVTNEDFHWMKERIREELREHGISHVTLELERKGEYCGEKSCRVESCGRMGHHHHHRHSHGS